MPKSYTGVYTASGKPVYNVEAYAATGAPTFSSSGKVCVPCADARWPHNMHMLSTTSCICCPLRPHRWGRGEAFARERQGRSPHRSSLAQELFAPVAYAEKVDGAKRQSSSNPKYLYHYTDDHSLHSISNSGYIKSSSGPGMPISSCRKESSLGQSAQGPCARFGQNNPAGRLHSPDAGLVIPSIAVSDLRGALTL